MIRKIHLDFHTHPDTPNIGSDFDPEAFADTLAEASVNYLTTPGKCHFGNIYYDTEVGHPHPHLEDPEMFPRTVEACLDRGIDVQAYWTLGLDSWAAKQHPEWRQQFEDGTFASWGHYLHMCFASPYVDEMVIPEVLECIERCPGLSGFWFDISLYLDGAFYSEDFTKLAQSRLGSDADDPEARWQLGREIVRERCVKIDEAIREHLPGAENYFNSLAGPGESENLALEPLHEVENPILFQTAEKMTTNLRWLRANGQETIGLASRFQGPWSDPGTIRTADQMHFDVARTVALGAHVSMGDHRYPDGRLEPEVYRRLGTVYDRLAELGPWLDNTVPCGEAVLMTSVQSGAGHNLVRPVLSEKARQAARILEENGLQFDVITTDNPIPDNADLVIWLGEEAGPECLINRLRDHLDGGGSLLAMGAALESPGAEALFGVTRREWTPTDDAGDTVGGMSDIGHVDDLSDASDSCGPAEQFIRFRDEVKEGSDFPFISKKPARLIDITGDVNVLADRCEPVSSKPPFAAMDPSGPMIVQHSNCIYSAPDLLGMAAEEGTTSPRQAVSALCDRLLTERRVRHDAGSSVAAHLYESQPGYTLHLVHWAMDRWPEKVNPVTEFPTLGPIEVRVMLKRTPKELSLEPAGQRLEWDMDDGVCTFTVPSMHIWQVIGVHMPSDQ